MTSFILSLAIRLTILMMLGLLVALATRRSTYAVRHVVIAATLACAIALPAMMLAVPQWRVGVLPATPTVAPLIYSRSALPVARPAGALALATKASLRPVLVTTYYEGAPATTSAMSSRLAPVTQSIVAPIAEPARTPFAPTVMQLALGVWLFGMLVGFAWIALGRIGLSRIRRRATPLESEEWRAILETERSHAGVEQHVTLLESRTVTSPVTWGVWAPVIVLPSASHSWTLDRKRVVVMHEMAHIARRDSATQLAATLASIVYWVHPLVLLAARRLRAECERACDERVLELGTPATDYAAHLLDVAKFARSFGAASIVSVAMARPSQLEGRLIAVLRSSPNRGRASVPSRAAASLFAAAMLIAISAFMPVERDTSSTSMLRSSRIPRVSELPNSRALANVTGSGTRSQAIDTTDRLAAPPAAPRVAPPVAPVPTVPSAPVPTPEAWAPVTAPTPVAPVTPPGPMAPAVPAPPAPSAELSLFASPMAFAAPAPPAQPAPWMSPAPLRVRAKPDTIFEKSVSATTGGTLDLDLDTGGDIMITGTDDAKVTVKASLGGTNWRETTVSLDGSGNQVRLESSYEQHSGNSSFDNAFTIRVPRKFNVHVSSAGGSVGISGVEGTFRGSTGGGPITIEHAKGDAQLSTGGGDIRISESHLDGSVTSGGGTVFFNNVTGGIISGAGNSDEDGNGYFFGYGKSGGNMKMPKYKVMVPDMKMNMKMKMPDMNYKMQSMQYDMPNVRFEMLDSAKYRKLMDAHGPEFEAARQAMRDAERSMRENQKSIERAEITIQSDDDDEMADSRMERTRETLERHQGAMDSARIILRRNRETMDRAREQMRESVDDSESKPRVMKMKHLRVQDGNVIIIDKDGGDIQLDDVPHEARVSTGGGAIIVGRARGAVSAHTGGGDIEIGPAEGAAAASTGAGDVSINLVGEAPHPVNVSSGKGDVEIILPSNANATLDLEVGYTKNWGKHPCIKGDWPLTVTETDTWDSSQGTPRKYVRVRQTLGKGGPVIRVRTVNGNIRLKRGS
ncbi:MAG TPA: M56 family metallopeptidase [Gemmatimonadaceae bacterium]|nr:M56 family metallopeptidase [Gemmatimonadaceae bacterium]